jgi:hypothetical protein
MTRFLAWPKSQSLLVIVLLSVSLVLGFMFYFQLLNRDLAPYNIVDFELAWTPEKAQTMLATWGEAGQAAARQSLWIDFAFMPTYALGMAALTLLAARSQAGRGQTLGLWLVPAPLLAWALDAVENFNLLAIVDQTTAAMASALTIAGWAATIKFLLLLACILYWLFALIARGLALARPKPV